MDAEHDIVRSMIQSILFENVVKIHNSKINHFFVLPSLPLGDRFSERKAAHIREEVADSEIELSRIDLFCIKVYFKNLRDFMIDIYVYIPSISSIIL